MAAGSEVRQTSYATLGYNTTVLRTLRSENTTLQKPSCIKKKLDVQSLKSSHLQDELKAKLARESS